MHFYVFAISNYKSQFSKMLLIIILLRICWVNSAIIASYITTTDMGTNVDNWEFNENEYSTCNIRHNGQTARCMRFSIYFVCGSNIYK